MSIDSISGSGFNGVSPVDKRIELTPDQEVGVSTAPSFKNAEGLKNLPSTKQTQEQITKNVDSVSKSFVERAKGALKNLGSWMADCLKTCAYKVAVFVAGGIAGTVNMLKTMASDNYKEYKQLEIDVFDRAQPNSVDPAVKGDWTYKTVGKMMRYEAFNGAVASIAGKVADFLGKDPTFEMQLRRGGLDASPKQSVLDIRLKG